MGLLLLELRLPRPALVRGSLPARGRGRSLPVLLLLGWLGVVGLGLLVLEVTVLRCPRLGRAMTSPLVCGRVLSLPDWPALGRRSRARHATTRATPN